MDYNESPSPNFPLRNNPLEIQTKNKQKKKQGPWTKAMVSGATRAAEVLGSHSKGFLHTEQLLSSQAMRAPETRQVRAQSIL